MMGYNRITIIGFIGSDCVYHEEKKSYLFDVRVPYYVGVGFRQEYIPCALKKSYFKKGKTCPLQKGDSVLIEGALRIYKRKDEENSRTCVSVSMFAIINTVEHNRLINSARQRRRNE